MHESAWILPAFWFIVMAAMLILEISTTALVSLWFVAGGLAAFILALLGCPLWLQTAVFAAVSALLFLTCRDWLTRHFAPRTGSSGADGLTGAIGTVTVAVEANGFGRAMVLGKDWRIQAYDRSPIEKDTMVRVGSIRGVTLIVIPIQNEEPI